MRNVRGPYQVVGTCVLFLEMRCRQAPITRGVSRTNDVVGVGMDQTRGKAFVWYGHTAERAEGAAIMQLLYVHVKNFKTNVKCSQFLPMANGFRFVMLLKVGASP